MRMHFISEHDREKKCLLAINHGRGRIAFEKLLMHYTHTSNDVFN